MAKILIIDDDKIIRERLQKLLDLSDFETFIAKDGLEGLDTLEKKQPDIVLLDIRMPGMDGTQVLKKIKEKSQMTEVIMITGHGGIETAIQALKGGAYGYIQKPIEFDELEIEINKALEKQRLVKKEKELIAALSNAVEAEKKKASEVQAALAELKETQAMLVQAGKMTALGELGAGVAHEMNQPLMSISTHLEMLLMNETVSSDPKLKEKLLKVKDQFIRLGAIVKRVSDYSSGRSGEYAEENVNRPLEDSYYLFGQQLKDHNIKVDMNLQKDLPLIEMDRYQVQDVVVNFLVNARDAIDEIYKQEEGGSITFVSKLLGPANVVIAGIIDNGNPIDEHIVSEIYNPFFTTKPPGKGTGLGLSICHTIVENHRGLINFQKLDDGKKIFYFLLPVDKGRDLRQEMGILKDVTDAILKWNF